MSEGIITTSLGSGIVQVQIKGPEQQNRLDVALAGELEAALDRLAPTGELKVLLLTGCGDVFCAGGSLDLLRRLADGEIEERRFLSITRKMLDFPVPIVGALNGHAVGGGMVLALACDLLVAASRSRYGFNFTNMGFTPGMGTTALLPPLVGHHFAAEMLLGGKLYKASELHARGLFNKVVDAARVHEEALALAERMADKPRHVLAMLKETLSLPRRQALHLAAAQEQLMQKVCFAQPETRAIIEDTYLDQS